MYKPRTEPISQETIEAAVNRLSAQDASIILSEAEALRIQVDNLSRIRRGQPSGFGESSALETVAALAMFLRQLPDEDRKALERRVK